MDTDVWKAGPGQIDERQFDMPILDRLAATVRRFPDADADADADAVIDPDGRIDYKTLWRHAMARAWHIQAASGDGAPVGILPPLGIDFIVSMQACMAAGRIPITLDAATPAARLADIVRAAGVRLVIGAIATPLAALGTEWLDLRAADDADDSPGGGPDQPRAIPALPVDAPAFTFATSGNSGMPKLVVQSQRSVLFQYLGNVWLFGLTPADRYVFTVASNSGPAWLHALSPLYAGGASLMCDVRAAGLTSLITLMARERASILRVSPSLMRVLLSLDSARAALTSLRVARLIGEAFLGLRYHCIAAGPCPIGTDCQRWCARYQCLTCVPDQGRPRRTGAEQPLFCKFPRGVSFGSIAQASMVR